MEMQLSLRTKGAANLYNFTTTGSQIACHDVHNGSRVKDAMLVTGKISGSDTAAGGYLCTQCHKK